MKKVLLLLAGACALTLVVGCAKKTVEPLPTTKTTMETSVVPSTPTPGIYGASGTTALTPAAPLEPTMTTGTPTVPPEPTLVADKAPKSTAKAAHAAPTAKETKAAKAAKAAKATPHGKKYVVKKGDTLSAIAVKTYGKKSAVKKIVAANPGMDPNLIKVGQTIILP